MSEFSLPEGTVKSDRKDFVICRLKRKKRGPIHDDNVDAAEDAPRMMLVLQEQENNNDDDVSFSYDELFGGIEVEDMTAAPALLQNDDAASNETCPCTTNTAAAVAAAPLSGVSGDTAWTLEMVEDFLLKDDDAGTQRLVRRRFKKIMDVDCCLSGTMTTLKFEVPLFDGRADFMLWQCTIQDYLVQQGLELALQDEKPSDMKESKWSTIQKKAVSTIRLALPPQIKVTVLKETSPKKLWETLESKFASKTLTNRLMMRMDLYSLKMEEGGSIIDHINKFNELVSRLLNAGETIKDEEQGLLLLASLPKSFKPFVQSMIAGRTTLRLDEVTTALKESQRMMGGEESSRDNHLLAAMISSEDKSTAGQKILQDGSIAAEIANDVGL
ncbi:unnamed protein product [Cuscuta campestris]|uniref:Retrovirus-related Pol polyprotein from transposon TNT 1-94 n=1 Tax=Cuscuta campestris TaxID=132261 RepID=A0A484KR82_9ASTE|nr:unnamed protein product [Cuscuta campestris]